MCTSKPRKRWRRKPKNVLYTPTPATPGEYIRHAMRSLEKLRLWNYPRDSGWRAAYIGTIRTQTQELELQAELADIQTEAARADKDRAVAELADFYYLYRLAFQIAKIVQMSDEPDILPRYVSETGRYYAIYGDDVSITVLIGSNGKLVLTAENPSAGIPQQEMELDETGLTEVAAKQIAEIYGKPLTEATTPFLLRN